MAAGIGEASAILNVAQIGLSLSKSLITYIEEVKGAPSHIRRVGDEILTTSERLKDIGDLINQNPRTKVFSEEGINSAVRCSTECQQIIKEVKNVLYKSGWQDQPRESEIGTSMFSTLRWPFAKIKLEVPRAELHRIKLDLSLLFSCAIVLRAPNPAEKQRLAQEIPGLQKARVWAAKRAEKAKEMAHYRYRNSRARDVSWSDDEPEMLEEFVTFKESLFREEEERRIRERVRIIQAEDDAKRRKEEDAQREVERKAVEEYKKNQREQETRAAEKRGNFQKELERLGLESAKIQVLMESSNLDFQAASGTAFVPEVRPSSSARDVSGEQEITQSAMSSWSRLNLLRWRPKKSTRTSSTEKSLSSLTSESSIGPQSELQFETWLIDLCTNRSTEIVPSADWLTAKMKTKKNRDVWRSFASLTPHWRIGILSFLEDRRQENPNLTLYHLEIIQGWSRRKLFGQKGADQLIQLILLEPKVNDQDSDMSRGRPKIEGPGGGLPKRVSFAGVLGEGSGTESGVNPARDNTRDNALTRNTSALRERIASLEEKRNGLGVHEYERLADINDMIDYLRDQLQSDATHTGALTTTFHDERETDAIKSGSNRAPMLVPEEYIQNTSRRDNTILEDRYNKSFSPSPRTFKKADDVSATSRYPRVAHNDLEIIQMDSSPEKTDYEGRYSIEKYDQYKPKEHQRRHREEEDIIVMSRDHDTSSQGVWHERSRSRSRSRPPRQDSFDTRGRRVISKTKEPRDKSWERSRTQPFRPSRLPEETDYYDQPQRRMVGSSYNTPGERSESEEERRSSEMREMVIRGDGRSKSRPREREYFSGSGPKYNNPRSRIEYGERRIVGASGQDQAFVILPGATSLPYDYERGRVLNEGIRMRGDDDDRSRTPGSAISHYIGRPSRPPNSRMSSYRDRNWAPSLRPKLPETWHHLEPTEDYRSGYPCFKRVDGENNEPETELSDAEVIAQTLKQFTTIQNSEPPISAISVAPVHTEQDSEAEVGPSAHKDSSHASPEPERRRSTSRPGRKGHFGQDKRISALDREGQSGDTNAGPQQVDDGPFPDRISGESTEDQNVSSHQRVVYLPARSVLSISPPKSPFTFPHGLPHHSREASSQPQSRVLSLDNPRAEPAHNSIVDEHGGSTLTSPGETPDNTRQEERYDVENIGQMRRNSTVQEEDENIDWVSETED